MRTMRGRAVEIFVIFIQGLILTGCDKVVSVSGMVRNSRGVPISFAKIHLTDMDEYGWTESGTDGCFLRSAIVAADPLHSSEPLTIEAPGFKTASAKVRGVNNKVTVTLVPTDSSGASQIQLLNPEGGQDSIPCKGSQ